MLVATAQGRSARCEGLSSWVELSFRLTTDDCVAGSCTEIDVVGQHLASAPCVVTNGKCKIDTTLNTAIPGYHFVASDGKNTGIQVLGCGLHSDAHGLHEPADLSCGVVLK